MATDLHFEVLPINATADLSGEGSKFKAISYGGTIAASNNAAAGLLRYGARSGERVSVSYMGIAKAQMGTAVSTAGFPVKVTTSGFLIACASGDTSIGRVLAITGSGDLAQVSYDFRNLGYFGG